MRLAQAVKNALRSLLGKHAQRTRFAYRKARFFSPIPREATYALVFTQERSGSTLFMDLLFSHPEVFADQHHFFTLGTWPASFSSGRRIFSSRPLRLYKAKMTHRPTQTSISAARRHLHTLQERGVRIIRLRRANKLRQALSVCVGQATRKLHRFDGEALHGKPHVDLGKLVEAMNYYEALNAFEEQVLEDVPHLSVTYEDDLLHDATKQPTADRVFEYLSLPPHSVGTRLSRSSPSKTLDDYVSNAAEVVETVTGTPHAHYLSEAFGVAPGPAAASAAYAS